MSDDPMHQALDRAIKSVGTKNAVARRLGISRQAINQWQQVPPQHVLELERMSGVSRHVLRPDIYGEPPRPVV